MTDIKKKKRAFKYRTPGQERDYETLSVNRMFKAYEDVPTNNTANVANWDPPLGKPAKVYKRKRRELDMETLKAELSRVDGRTKVIEKLTDELKNVRKD